MKPVESDTPVTGPETRELLLKEFDERHHYAKLAAQIYIAWYTFFVTSNLAVIGVSLTNPGNFLAIRVYVGTLFLLINILGIVATFILVSANKTQDLRIKEIRCLLDPSPEKVSSAYPHKLIRALLIALAVSLILIMAFWAGFLILLFF